MNPAPVFLLVEPSLILHLRIHEWLENVLSDPRIFVAASGLQALWLAAQEQPSHILIEMNLPDITSFEIVRQLRQGQQAARIIATGGYENRFFLDRIFDAGADGFIFKNKLHSELLSLLFQVPLSKRMDNGKTSACLDHRRL
jgi:two-component system, NarL family, invasion response regulator UvrY